MHGKLELVKVLLKAGADVNLSWKNGLTAICMVDSESKYYFKILETLIKAGANVNDLQWLSFAKCCKRKPI